MDRVFLEGAPLTHLLYLSIYYTFYLKVIDNTIFYMILQANPATHQPNTQPFQDIINQQIQNLYEDVQKEYVRRSEQDAPSTVAEKENRCQDEDGNTHDRTIRKDHNKYDLCTLSSKTIREENQNILPQMDDAPDFDLLLGKVGEVHRVINCSSSFEETKTLFLEQSKKEKLNMCQNTDGFATVKKGSLNSCKCIIRMWTQGETDSTVYQLRCINRESKRFKIILLEGDEAKFTHFCLKFMNKLAKDKLMKLTTRDQIQLFYFENCTGILQLQKEAVKLMGKSKKSKSAQGLAEALLEKVKEECNRLKMLIKSSSQIQFTLAYERQFEDLCYRQSSIFTLFNHIYKKQYENYQKKREILLKKWNLFDIFKQLEISEHFEQFRKRRESLRSTNKAFNGLPYMPAVKSLQQIKGISSPGSILEKIMVFQGKVKSCYNEYFINKMRVSDMDDYLPITIYCTLAMENDENLLATTKLLLAYLSKQDEFQWEKKILTNLQAAFEFIHEEWKVQSI